MIIETDYHFPRYIFRLGKAAGRQTQLYVKPMEFNLKVAGWTTMKQQTAGA